MLERNRTVWNGVCGCGWHGICPDDRPSIKSVSQICPECGLLVEYARESWTGPELEPMMPDVHHIWCNGQRGPVKGCRWCCPKDDASGYRDGLWVRYPYDPATGPDENFTKHHFPNVVERR